MAHLQRCRTFLLCELLYDLLSMQLFCPVLLLFDGDEHLKMIENDEIATDGVFPMNPSGGVIGSNPIGATAMVRVAEAALQVLGDAGEHQVKGDINTAMASGFGGTMWSVLFLLTKEPPVLN